MILEDALHTYPMKVPNPKKHRCNIDGGVMESKPMHPLDVC